MAAAEEAVRAVRATQFGTRPDTVVVPAVGGAGKTTLLASVADDVTTHAGEAVAVCVNTNAQLFDLTLRMAGATSVPVVVLPGNGVAVPPDVLALARSGRVTIETFADLSLRRPPWVALATASKWAWAPAGLRPLADVLLVDEAYQLHDALFRHVSSVGQRRLMVGDEGQIDPVVKGDVRDWAHLLDGPHRPAPAALLARAAGVTVSRLPYTRRLPADSVPYLAAFYPNMAVASVVPVNARGLRLAPALRPDRVDRLLDAAAAGASVLLGELPARRTDVDDPELAETMASVATRFLRRGAEIRVDGGWRALTPEDIAIFAAHNAQEAAVAVRLAGGPADGALTGTANRLQGLQRPVVLSWHPLSGLDEVDDFHADAGRACVMTSRHQVVDLFFARAGLSAMIEENLPASRLVPGVPDDPAFAGWRTHTDLLQRLHSAGRVLRLGH